MFRNMKEMLRKANEVLKHAEMCRCYGMLRNRCVYIYIYIYIYIYKKSRMLSHVKILNILVFRNVCSCIANVKKCQDMLRNVWKS